MQSMRTAFTGSCLCRWHYYLLDYCYVVHATLLVSRMQTRDCPDAKMALISRFMQVTMA